MNSKNALNSTFSFFVGIKNKSNLDYVPHKFMLSYNISKKIKVFKTDKEWIMDSGAFGQIELFGKFNFSIDEYLTIIEKFKPNHFVVMDYICEPFILKKWNRTVKEHQLRTIENHILIKEKMKDYNIKSQLMGVIQGWKVEDYLNCIDQLKSYGLIENYMGIGSICRRQQDKEILRVIKAVKDNLPSYVKLHGFGVKTSLLKKRVIYDYLSSSDSMAWSFDGRYNKKRKNNICGWTKQLCIHLNHVDCSNCGIQLKYWTLNIENIINKMLNDKKGMILNHYI